METIEITIISEFGQIVGIETADFWEENEEDAPYEWDETDQVTVPLEEWENGNINFSNVKTYLK